MGKFFFFESFVLYSERLLDLYLPKRFVFFKPDILLFFQYTVDTDQH